MQMVVGPLPFAFSLQLHRWLLRAVPKKNPFWRLFEQTPEITDTIGNIRLRIFVSGIY